MMQMNNNQKMEAEIKKIIIEEVNKEEKIVPLHEIIYLMKKKYQELHRAKNYRCLQRKVCNR